MKGGDIRLSEWREIDRQINNLVELPINLPQCQPISDHVPFFVTNGRIDDVVLDYINTANLGWQRRSFHHPLHVIEKSQLVHRFIAVHGTFLPHEASDFQRLLTLLLSDGTAPLDKPSFSHFLGTVSLFAEGTAAKTVSRSLSSAVLLTSYILGSVEKVDNHWAVFEGWTITASYILAAATKFSLAEELWRRSFDIAMLGAERALDDLVQECKERQQFVEGTPLVDGFFYGSRQLIIAGLLSAWALRRRRSGFSYDHQVEKIVLSRLRESSIWGESAAPFVMLSSLELEQQCKTDSCRKSCT